MGTRPESRRRLPQTRPPGQPGAARRTRPHHRRVSLPTTLQLLSHERGFGTKASEEQP
jgi:hypothetical protein